MVTQRRGSLIATLAERAASHPSMEAAVMGAVRTTLPRVIESVLGEMFPGETIRLYVPKAGLSNRSARDMRIEGALRTGEPQRSIALREGVSLRHVERISARITRQSVP